jgi:hypothetical protein
MRSADVSLDSTHTEIIYIRSANVSLDSTHTEIIYMRSANMDVDSKYNMHAGPDYDLLGPLG